MVPIQLDKSTSFLSRSIYILRQAHLTMTIFIPMATQIYQQFKCRMLTSLTRLKRKKWNSQKKLRRNLLFTRKALKNLACVGKHLNFSANQRI